MAAKDGSKKDLTGLLFRMLEDKLELEKSFGVEVVPASKPSPSPLGGEGRGEGGVSASSPLPPGEGQGEGAARGQDPGRHEIRNPNEESEPKPETRMPHDESPPPLRGRAGVGGAVSAPSPVPADASKTQRLAALEAEMAGCTECPLSATRTNLVFGVGNPEAEILFIGEAPGADEDAQGIPFVGRAGQLLTRIIIAMGLQREDVYIANILKCRPPGNRNPRPSEVVHCLPYLRRQIAVIQPKVIVCLGGVAAKTLLQSEMPVGRMRGTFLDYEGTPLLVTFHPAFLLRNPSGKTDVWEDMKMVLHKLGRPIPK